MNKPIGVYIHVPFCVSKCPYCDFYSVSSTEQAMDAYTDKLIKEIKESEHKQIADTVYFGGGTPSLLGEKRLIRIFSEIEKNFPLCKDYEATVEVNPGDDLKSFLREIKSAGINRLSIGMQSANDEELSLLGRRHSHKDTVRCVKDAACAGFDNYSLDIMLAISGQTQKSLEKTVQACSELEASHASAYLLKIEDNTPYAKMQSSLSLPDNDASADFYLNACSLLEDEGFSQYEISNFAKKGKESRHNLKYWECDEYIGFGAAAHSFIGGKRFYYERNIDKYINNPVITQDGAGGDIEEYSLLSLRLSKGITLGGISLRYGEAGRNKFFDMKKKAEKFSPFGYVNVSDNSISLTKKGFLVSNRLFYEIIE